MGRLLITLCIDRLTYDFDSIVIYAVDSVVFVCFQVCSEFTKIKTFFSLEMQ